MPIQSKQPKEPQEDREPQRREDLDHDEEASRGERGEELVNDDVMEALFEDDLKNMEGPDA